MTRRKKPPPQHKRQRITDSAGWTHIIRGPPGTIDPQSAITRLESVKKSTETKYTLETYLDRFRNHYIPIWKESHSFQNLGRILEQDVLPTANKSIKITQCICLGLGSPTTGSEDSSFELAALTSMLEILGTDSPYIPTIFQDPLLNDLDRAILSKLNYTVLDTPHAFPRISNETFLFAPHLECSHYATAIETAAPALCVGSDVQVYVDGLLSSVAESSKKGSCRIFREFVNKVDSHPMPNFDRTPWCESTRIYWLKSKEDGSQERLIEQGVNSMT